MSGCLDVWMYVWMCVCKWMDGLMYAIYNCNIIIIVINVVYLFEFSSITCSESLSFLRSFTLFFMSSLLLCPSSTIRLCSSLTTSRFIFGAITWLTTHFISILSLLFSTLFRLLKFYALSSYRKQLKQVQMLIIRILAFFILLFTYV